MKWWLWLLALVNVALFAYFNLLQPVPAGPQPGHEPIRPELLRILPPPTEAAAGAAPLDAVACYAWGNFSADSMARAQGVLRTLGLQYTIGQIALQDATRYWVYIPPHRSLEEAQAKAEELRLRGVADFYVVLEPPWRYAIFLGVFQDERLADNLLQQLAMRGIFSAVKAVRNQEGEQSNFYLGRVSPAVVDELSKLQPDFPGSELKPVGCQ
jgi:hypothetical protein